MSETAALNPVNNTTGVVPVVGFVVKSISLLSPKAKDEEDMGKIRILLEAETNDVRATGKELPAILGALNMHRVDREPVAVQLRF